MDLRLPIGLLFSIFGVMLTVTSFVIKPDPPIQLLGIDINLLWGIVLLVFGLTMGGAALKKSS